ncbi:MAG: RDD family protein [Wenzhouxiangellaceae bacterium]
MSQPCSLPRRFAAMIYDSLLLIAVWMVGTALVLPLGGGEIDGGSPLFRAWLLLLAFAYFHTGWQRAGQTLGMRAWRIRLQHCGNRRFTAFDSLRRFSAGLLSLATLGLGFGWSLLREDRRAWPDLASDSRLVVYQRDSAAQ